MTMHYHDSEPLGTNCTTYRLEFPCGRGSSGMFNNVDDPPTLTRVWTKGIVDEVEGAPF